MKLLAVAILVLAVAISLVGWRMTRHSKPPCSGYCSPGYTH